MTIDGMCLYVGIDPSLTKPGLAILNKIGSVLFVGSLSVGQNVRGAARLQRLFDWARQQLKPFQRPVRKACIEGPSFGSIHREFDLGEASGVLKLAVYSDSTELVVVPPTSAKLFATGQGHAEKRDMIHAVKIHYGVDVGADNDAADAFVLARIAWALDNEMLLTRRSEIEVVRSVLHPKPKKKKASLKGGGPNI